LGVQVSPSAPIKNPLAWRGDFVFGSLHNGVNGSTVQPFGDTSKHSTGRKSVAMTAVMVTATLKATKAGRYRVVVVAGYAPGTTKVWNGPFLAVK
jgi:hypothetical protein